MCTKKNTKKTVKRILKIQKHNDSDSCGGWRLRYDPKWSDACWNKMTQQHDSGTPNHHNSELAETVVRTVVRQCVCAVQKNMKCWNCPLLNHSIGVLPSKSWSAEIARIRGCGSTCPLTPYKLTGWFASLDLHQPHTKLILRHWKTSPHVLSNMWQ